MRIAINGLGRIGRAALKVALERPGVELVAVNDLADLETLKYLLKYDSVYGRFDKTTELGRSIKILSEKDPTKLPWSDLGVDIIIESTGAFANRKDAAKHLEAGAKKVIISANSDDADLSVVMGVNHQQYDPEQHDVLANCSCTTNCAAPVMKVLNDNFTVKKGYMTTIHAVTSTQNLVDGPNEKLRRGRAAFASIIPTTTGAADAVIRVLPELEGRVTGAAFRVPVLCGSVLEVVAHIAKETSPDEVNQVFEQAAAGDFQGIIEVNDEGLVSADIPGTTASAIVDLPSTTVIKDFVRLVAWYDNEYAYAVRLIDLVEHLASQT
jgi:glyceraldehyde 3-phosphate dehydrogenase